MYRVCLSWLAFQFHSHLRSFILSVKVSWKARLNIIQKRKGSWAGDSFWRLPFMHPTWPQRGYQSKSASTDITFTSEHILFPFKCSAASCFNGWVEYKLVMFEVSVVSRTAYISRSSLMHRSIPITGKAIVDVVLAHYQLVCGCFQKLWRQLCQFNCTERWFFIFCIVSPTKKKKSGSNFELQPGSILCWLIRTLWRPVCGVQHCQVVFQNHTFIDWAVCTHR